MEFSGPAIALEIIYSAITGMENTLSLDDLHHAGATIPFMLALLRMVAWWCCILYASVPLFWLMIHPRVEYWRRWAKSPYRVLVPAWVGSWIAVGLVTAPWRDVALYNDGRAWWPAGMLLGCGFAIYVAVAGRFGAAQVSGKAELRPGEEQQALVTTGIHGRVRHPLYLAHLCEMLGWSIGTGLAVCFALTALAVVLGAVMIRLEDTELEKRFGAEFAAYRQSVHAILPRIRLSSPYNPSLGQGPTNNE
jgi:protein-S-isoprenylcysteine O-methyltransferase Ste14